jgi:hypothetical protein
VRDYLTQAREELARAEKAAKKEINLLRLTYSAFEEPTIFDLGLHRLNALIELANAFGASLPPKIHKRAHSPVPPDVVRELADIYRRSTGKDAGRGEGPFARFVHTFWRSLGMERGIDAVVKDIKATD